MTERPLSPALPAGVDDEAYRRLRGRMRFSVLRMWRNERVVAGMDPWGVVDEAWASMAEGGFQSVGPFEPFALRVAMNKAMDALNRAEARRRDRSLDEPIAASIDGTIVLADTVAGSQGADEEYFDHVEHQRKVEQLEWVQEAVFSVLSTNERSAFLAVVRNGKSRAAVGRELDPPVTGQRVGQIVAVAATKIKRYVDEKGMLA